MALRWAIASGNWNNPAIWNGGTTPSSDGTDQVHAGGFTVTLNVDINVDYISTRPSGSAPGLGTFAPNANRIYICDVIAGDSNCIASSAVNYTVIGDLYGGTQTGTRACFMSAGMTLLTVIGNVYGNTGQAILQNAAGGVAQITGDVYGGINSGILHNTNFCTTEVTGNVYGGSGSNGILCNIIGTIRVFGAAIGLDNCFSAIHYGHLSSGEAIVEEAISSPTGILPVSGRVKFYASPTFRVVLSDNSLLTLTDPADAQDFPNSSDLRFGTSCKSGEIVGTLRVPPKEAVSAGVLVDHTVGEAVIKPDVLASILVSLNV